MSNKNHVITLKTEYITLGQFLKLIKVIESGGEAKSYLATNVVKVNNLNESRRGRKLFKNDVVVIENEEYVLKCM